MLNILTWETRSGILQKETEMGAYSVQIAEKPSLSFDFNTLKYIEQSNIYEVDGLPLTTSQKKEILKLIGKVKVPLDWYKEIVGMNEYQKYMTDMRALVGNVDQFESSSWAKQEAEARAFKADASAPTPLLSSLVANRDGAETVSTLADKIIKKADAYNIAYAKILGAYQSKKNKIASATSVADLQAI
jgi:hypothetical protein